MKNIYVDFVAPIVIYALFVLFYFRRRLKVLRLATKNGSMIDFYSFILLFALSVPTIISQTYLEKAVGKLTPLENIKSLNLKEQTKYYTLKNFYFDKDHGGFHAVFDVSGKHNQNFDMNLYVVLPIFEKAEDTLGKHATACLAIKYYKTISNRLKPSEKESIYKVFAEESWRDFQKTNLNSFTYLEKVGHTDDEKAYREALKQNTSYIFPANAPILRGKEEAFESRFGNHLEWIFGSLCIGAIIWLIMVLIPKLDTGELTRFESGKPAIDNSLKEMLEFITPKEGFFITPILMHITLAIYLIMFLSGFGFLSFKGSDLLLWGANFRPLVKEGEWWRLLTNIFLHGGLMHIIANIIGLAFVGVFLEPLLGRVKFLAVYLLTGLLASAASIWWHEATVSVGASGAIFGLYGVFLAMLLTKVFPPEFAKSFLLSTLIFVGINLAMGLAGGIDNAAHIGGLLSGFIIGLVLRRFMDNELTKDGQ
jgi:membrane associated rhomboid family serine protease